MKELDDYDVLLCLIYHLHPFLVMDVAKEIHIKPEELGFILSVFKDHPVILKHKEEALKNDNYIRDMVIRIFEGTIYKEAILSLFLLNESPNRT